MRYRTIEFIVATEYKPKLGKLYYLGADGNIYETTMGPKSKGYKAPMVVELNLKREKGWLYFFKRNPDVEYDIVENEKKARYPKESVLEVWRCLESLGYLAFFFVFNNIIFNIWISFEKIQPSFFSF